MRLLNAGLRGRLLNARGFLAASVARLFSQGANGLWLDPRPEYLYEDSAGTIDDVVHGDPVGLGLDRHKGLALGPELVTNGTFDDGTAGWVARSNTSISVVNGRLRATAIADGSFGVDYSLTVDSGVSYDVDFKVLSVETPSLFVGLQGDVITTSSPKDISRISLSDGDGRFSAAASSSSLAGDYFEIDNISVRELPGNHLTQPTSADRPMYNTDGTLHWLENDAVSDYMLSAFSPLDLMAEPFILSIASVFVNTGVDGDDFFVSLANGSDVSNWFGIRRQSTGEYALRMNDSTSASKDITGFQEDGAKHVFTVTGNGAGVVEFFIDGVFIGSTNPAGLTVSTLALFDLYRSTFGSFNQSPMRIFGLVFAAGSNDREPVDKYLAKKAGITL